jgi:hypothetical protein
VYVAHFRMRPGGTRHVMFERRRGGGIRTRPDLRRREPCGLLRSVALRRAAFGGRRRTPLRLAYRVRTTADVTITLTRRGRVVRRVVHRGRASGRTHRVTMAASRLKRGIHRIRVRAVGGDERAAARIVARRL